MKKTGLSKKCKLTIYPHTMYIKLKHRSKTKILEILNISMYFSVLGNYRECYSILYGPACG